MDIPTICRAARWFLIPALIALSVPAETAIAADLLNRADPGPPRAPKHFRAVSEPNPLPAGSWVAPGSTVNPGGALPIEALDAHPLQMSPGGIRETWVIRTWRVPQVLGSDPWPGLDVLRFEADGSLLPREPSELFGASIGRPIVFFIHGNLVSGRLAENEALYGRAWLDAHGGLSPETLVVIFDWPAYQVMHVDLLDGSEKQRRGFLGGYHLARVLMAFPPGSRICLIGHSLGCRVTLSALQLFGDGPLLESPPIRAATLPAGAASHLRLRAVLVGSGDDHHWLNPGNRFDHALLPVEGLLNLYNPQDRGLALYPLSLRSDHHPALGHIGLRPADLRRIGPLAARVEQRDIAPAVGPVHTLAGALAHPDVAAWIAPYSFATEANPVLVFAP